MKIDHGNLRALAAVVREGSFERAALALSVTPSAVSQRIKALEDRMGRLLVQRTVPAAATADGRVLVQLAEQTALLEHDALNRLGVAEDDVPHASIPIAVNHDSLETWFVEAALVRRAPAPRWICSPRTRTTAALLRNGAVLGAVTTLADPVQGCRIHALGSMRYVATCSPDFHKRYFSQGVNAQTLAQAPVLVFNRRTRCRPASRTRSRIPRPGSRRSGGCRPPAFVQATLGGLG